MTSKSPSSMTPAEIARKRNARRVWQDRVYPPDPNLKRLEIALGLLSLPEDKLTADQKAALDDLEICQSHMPPMSMSLADMLIVALRAGIRFLKYDRFSRAPDPTPLPDEMQADSSQAIHNAPMGKPLRARRADTARELQRRTGTDRAQSNGWIGASLRTLAVNFDGATGTKTKNPGTFYHLIDCYTRLLDAADPSMPSIRGVGKVFARVTAEIAETRRPKTSSV